MVVARVARRLVCTPRPSGASQPVASERDRTLAPTVTSCGGGNHNIIFDFGFWVLDCYNSIQNPKSQIQNWKRERAAKRAGGCEPMPGLPLLPQQRKGTICLVRQKKVRMSIPGCSAGSKT